MLRIVLPLLLTAAPSYSDRYAQAIAERKALVVFVGCSPFDVPGAVVHHSAKGFDWHSKPGILIARPFVGRQGLEWVATLPPTASPQQVRDAAMMPRAAPVASAVSYFLRGTVGGGANC